MSNDKEEIKGLKITLKNALAVSKEQEREISKLRDLLKSQLTPAHVETIILYMPFEFRNEAPYSFKKVCELLDMFRSELAEKVSEELK